MKKIKNSDFRHYILIIGVLLVCLILIGRLFDLQIIHAQEYKEKAEKKLIRTYESKAPRGDIYDRNGELLATSEVIYNLNLYRTKKTQEDLNKLLINIANILTKNGDILNNSFPIDLDTKTYKIEGNKQKNWQETYNIEGYTEEEAIEYFKNKYMLQEYDDFEIKLLIPLRYELINGGYSSYKAVTIAKNISKESIHELEERNTEFTGVYISQDTLRKYPYENTLSHLIGYVGKISSDELDTKKELGYNSNSIIGKLGVEKSFENYLRGIDGTKRIEMDSQGVIYAEEEINESKKGNDVYLTIDIKLQQKVEEVLKNIINQIQNVGINGLKYKDATAGSAVVLNVKTGEVLSIASYPDYNPQDFVNGISQEKYDLYFQNPDKPLYNRAIQGIYPPGSTFKMVTAIAGIESGVVTVNEKINDVGIYNKAHKPACWLWNSRRQTHGYVNAQNALKVSCNYYFYEIASRMGIDTLAEYAKKFGLGQKTGIEIIEEESGVLSSKEYIESQNKKGKNLTWTLGDTLSSGIGQSYNLFTPIQMANYISTIANKGKKTDLTILKEVKDCFNNELNKTEVKKYIDAKLGVLNRKNEDIKIKDETINAIFEGMRSVTGDRGGTVYGTFNNFPIEVAGKTGTATSGNGSDNAWFVGFAPYDDPEIAVVVLVEHGGHGYFTARAVKDIMEEYFGYNKIETEENDI